MLLVAGGLGTEGLSTIIFTCSKEKGFSLAQDCCAFRFLCQITKYSSEVRARATWAHTTTQHNHLQWEVKEIHSWNYTWKFDGQNIQIRTLTATAELLFTSNKHMLQNLITWILLSHQDKHSVQISKTSEQVSLDIFKAWKNLLLNPDFKILTLLILTVHTNQKQFTSNSQGPFLHIYQQDFKQYAYSSFPWTWHKEPYLLVPHFSEKNK